jgi:hypothetical protein
VTMFQAFARGALCRAVYEERKVEVFSALQLLQNYVRRILARLLVRRMKRELKLRLFVREEKETQLMWRSDQFSQFYRTCFDSALNIQRVFRGYVGRIKAAEDAFEISRQRGVNWCVPPGRMACGVRREARCGFVIARCRLHPQ